MSKHEVETYIFTKDQEIRKCAFCLQSDIGAVLGLKYAHP
jgi:hypothetical protein